MSTNIPTSEGFHAHVYYDADSKAEALRAEIDARYDVDLGRWHDKPLVPHPFGSYLVAFKPELFGEIVPWLAMNRRDLSILVHPETGDDLTDHSILRHVAGRKRNPGSETISRAGRRAG